MSRKDYVLIATAIKDQYEECTTEDERIVLRMLTGKLASRLAADNPLFLRDKFYTAAVG